MNKCGWQAADDVKRGVVGALCGLPRRCSTKLTSSCIICASQTCAWAAHTCQYCNPLRLHWRFWVEITHSWSVASITRFSVDLQRCCRGSIVLVRLARRRLYTAAAARELLRANKGTFGLESLLINTWQIRRRKKKTSVVSKNKDFKVSTNSFFFLLF